MPCCFKQDKKEAVSKPSLVRWAQHAASGCLPLLTGLCSTLCSSLCSLLLEELFARLEQLHPWLQVFGVGQAHDFQTLLQLLHTAGHVHGIGVRR